MVFTIASGILLTLAGAIGWLWLQPRDPARLNVSRPEVSRQMDGHSYVSAEVRNDGDETAEAVEVVAELSVGGDVVADGEQVVDFLSGGETQEIVFVFDTVALPGPPRGNSPGGATAPPGYCTRRAQPEPGGTSEIRLLRLGAVT